MLVIFLNQVKSVKTPLGLKSVTFQRSFLGAEVFNMSKPAGSTSGCLDILNVKSSEYRLSLLLRYSVMAKQKRSVFVYAISESKIIACGLR